MCWRKLLTCACVLLFSACNLPSERLTQTPVPAESQTPVPVMPTFTPTFTATATVTPLPPEITLDQADLRGAQIILWHALRGESKKKLDELILKFNDENAFGITLRAEFDISISDQSERIEDALGSAGLPHLIIADNTYLRKWESDGLQTVDLSIYLQDPQNGFDALGITPILEPMLAQETVDEQMRALPLWHDPAFLFYNKTWAQELGFENTPVSFAEFAEQVCAANRAVGLDENVENDGTGGWIVQTDVPAAMSWIMNFGATAESMDSFWKQGETGDFVKTAEWLRELYDKNCLWISRLKEPYDYFADRYALFYSGTYSDARRQLNAFAKAQTYAMDNWDIIPYPRKTKDGQPQLPNVYSTGMSAAIPKSDFRSQYAAWLFLSWLMQDERAAELALTAEAWPVQDSEKVTRLYQNSGKGKLLQTLTWRDGTMAYPVNGDWIADSLVLSDGFQYVFSLTSKVEDAAAIWQQIGSSIQEVNELDQTQNKE